MGHRSAAMRNLMRLVLLALIAFTASAQQSYCQFGQTCWPTIQQINAFERTLDPTASRILRWDGHPHPRVSAVPIYSPNDQPLYGLGASGLKALYVRTQASLSCFVNGTTPPEFCLAAVRNNPGEGWNPGFVVWPLNENHVQSAVQFAKAHNLCVMVAGTGHDYLNRHSCRDGVFIRTSLMKDIEWDLNDEKGFGFPEGNVKFGPGIVFSEAHKTAADNGRFISSGWAITVGVVGWSIGGGHGPFAPSKGLGVDNILEIEIVIASGELIVANATGPHKDLFWALRGGGGSTWGVITAITLRAHVIPDGGFTFLQAQWANYTVCDSGLQQLQALSSDLAPWMLNLDNRFGGLIYFIPTASNDPTNCGAIWTVMMVYAYLGNSTDPVCSAVIDQVGNFQVPPVTSSINNVPNWFAITEGYPLEPIIPVNYLAPSSGYAGAIPSVAVSREVLASEQLLLFVRDRLVDCANTSALCSTQELFHDLTGYIGSPQDPNVSISAGLRTAVVHFVSPTTPAGLQALYALGDNSYFSESSYDMDASAFASRYWGNNADALTRVKRDYDPNGFFGCRNCISLPTTHNSDIQVAEVIA